MPESRGILVKTSKKPIGINFTMLKNREQVFSKAIDNKEFGYDTNGLVVVQYPNPEKLSAIKMIEKHMKHSLRLLECKLSLEYMLIMVLIKII